MDSNYSPVDIAKDAVRFSESPFGKHYMKRLEAVRDDYQTKATDRRFTNEERGLFGLLAAETADHLGYFETARTITRDPALIKKLKDGFKKRKKGGSAWND